MRELYNREFTNTRGDKVSVVVLADSFGGYHLISKTQLLRKTAEKRMVGGVFTDIPVITFTEETKHALFTTEYSALNELNLERVMNGDPLFSRNDYAEWQRTTTDKEMN